MLARTLLLVFLAFAVISAGSLSAIPPLTVSTLQQNLYGNTNKYFCVLFQDEDSNTTLLESSVDSLFQKKTMRTHLLGSYRVPKKEEKLKLFEADTTFPLLRCFQGSTLFHDFKGSHEPHLILRWVKRLKRQYLRWMSNNVSTIEESVSQNPVTLVSLTSLAQAPVIANVCQEALKKLENHCALSIVFIHPFSEHKSAVQQHLNITAPSAIAVLTKPDKHSPLASAVFQGRALLRQQITSHILSKLLAVKHLTVKNFESETMTIRKTERFLPYFVGFYAWWAKHCHDFLSSLKSAVGVFRSHSILSKFALVNVATEKTVISRYVKTTKSPPFLVLFQREKGKDSVNVTVLDISHPTAFYLKEELRSRGITMYDAWHKKWNYNPYKTLDFTHYCDVNEGPSGIFCTSWTHNQTDSDAVPGQDVKISQSAVEKKKQIEDLMKKMDGIPVMTATLWAASVEKSEQNLALYTSSSKVIVTVIVFIRANCGSCQSKMAVFRQLNKEYRKFENRRLFMVNCTEEVELCKKLEVKGYPSVVAIRSFGILASRKCSVPHTEPPYVSREYHGAIEMSFLISWLNELSESSLQFLNFGEPVGFREMNKNVRLIATAVPKTSKYVPVAPDGDRNYYYSMACFRLACERLYGLASCHVSYSRDIPASEFKDKEDASNMVIFKVQFERKDGISMTLMSLRKPLFNLLQEETQSNIHLFHRPHQYPISSSQTCEEDHNSCTQTLVDFTKDHLRLPVTKLSSEIFHTRNNPLFSEGKPVLVALGSHDNVTESSSFMQLLYRVASELYKEVVVTAMDVESYPSWAGRFVPQNYYRHFSDVDHAGPLHEYPRLCLVDWRDHGHAAFYPPLQSLIGDNLESVSVERELDDVKFVLSNDEADVWDAKNLMEYVKNYLKDPSKLVVKTEHF